MPSQAALERGSAVAQGIIDSHKQANAGAYPETVAVCANASNAILIALLAHTYMMAVTAWDHASGWMPSLIVLGECAGQSVGPGCNQDQGRECCNCAVHGWRSTCPRRHWSHCKVCSTYHLTAPKQAIPEH